MIINKNKNKNFNFLENIENVNFLKKNINITITTKKYKIFIIKLKNYKNGEIQLKDLIESFELFNKKSKINIFNAIKGNEGHKVLNDFLKIFNLNKKDFLPKLLPDKHKGRIGCLASHLILWIMCIIKNKNFIILENDSLLVNDYEPILNDIQKDVILLDPFCPYDINYNKNIKKNNKIDLKINDKHTKFNNFKTKGAYSYIMTPNGAKKILNSIIKSKKWLPADYYLNDNLLNIGTTNKTIFRINNNFPAGVISSTKNL